MENKRKKSFDDSESPEPSKWQGMDDDCFKVMGISLKREDIHYPALKTILRKIMEAKYRKMIHLENFKVEEQVTGPGVELLKSAIEDYRKDVGCKLTTHGNSMNVWLTVNPKEGHTWQQLHALLVQMSTWKWIVEMMFAFEITENKERSPHVHCLILKANKAKPSLVSRQIRGLFKDMVKDPASKAQINIQHIPDTDINDKERYIMGKKFKNRKMPEVELTKAWRKTVGCEDYYVLPDERSDEESNSFEDSESQNDEEIE